jgi:DNA-binding NarL/FixJ family response regulator
MARAVEPDPTDLERGRRFYEEQGWRKAFEAFLRADQVAPLGGDDLELLARSAYMLGRDDDYVAALERAHELFRERGELPRAVRCTFWIGHSFLFRGEKARGAGWFARGQRLLEVVAEDCVERGYMRVPLWLEEMGRGNFEGAYAIAVEVAGIGERFDDADLVWLARDDQASALLRLGRVDEGLRLVEEALAAATAGDLSPLVTGIVYCNTIAFCRKCYQLRHVRAWIQALTRWCECQPEMVAHNGLCLVHRAEMMLLAGDWARALEESCRSAERFSMGALNQLARGAAFYCQGEAHRLRGDLEEAESAYRQASLLGREPQPGLALVRLAQHKEDAAAAAIRRVIGETTSLLARAGLLPAYVDIMLSLGNNELAEAACRELAEIASRTASEVVEAMAAHAHGSLALADGRAQDALLALRRALGIWTDVGAPYEVARVRVRLGMACRALGDEDSASLELDAAKKTFTELGAAPDLAWVEASCREPRSDGAHGLTGRELEVLRLVAAGKTNKEIAAQLFISEHTIARHIQNIFGKLSVSSRTEAASFAFAHGLHETGRGQS